MLKSPGTEPANICLFNSMTSSCFVVLKCLRQHVEHVFSYTHTYIYIHINTHTHTPYCLFYVQHAQNRTTDTIMRFNMWYTYVSRAPVHMNDGSYFSLVASNATQPSINTARQCITFREQILNAPSSQQTQQWKVT